MVGCQNDCSCCNNRAEPECNWGNQSVKLVASPSRNYDAREECKGRKHCERQGVDDLHRKSFPLPNTSAGWPYPRASAHDCRKIAIALKTPCYYWPLGIGGPLRKSTGANFVRGSSCNFGLYSLGLPASTLTFFATGENVLKETKTS